MSMADLVDASSRTNPPIFKEHRPAFVQLRQKPASRRLILVRVNPLPVLGKCKPARDGAFYVIDLPIARIYFKGLIQASLMCSNS